MDNLSWFEKQSELHFQQLLPNTVLQLMAGVIGVLGNSVVLLMYTKYVQDSKGTRYFIPILALVDLVGCISNVIKFHLEDTVQYFYPDRGLCKFLSFCMVMFGSLSALLIFVIALQRYLLICRPFSPQMNIRKRRLAILITFLLAFAGAVPALPFAGVRELTIENSTGTSPAICNFGYGSQVRIPYFGSILVASIITILGAVCLYIPVIKRIHRRFSSKNAHSNCREIPNTTTVYTVQKNIEAHEHSFSEQATNDTDEEVVTKPANTRKISREQMTRRISFMFLDIIIVYVVSFVTSLITTLYVNINGTPKEGYKLNIYYFFLRFNLLNHILNPYIYWFFDVNFRQELRNFWYRLSCKQRT